MENKFRNEMEIVLGGQKILLRPTFENIAAMESNVGSVAWLGWKYSRGVRIDSDGKVVAGDMEQTVRSLPSMSEAAKIIYLNQAEKKFSQDEIWELVLGSGSAVARQIVLYLARVTAGDRSIDKSEVTEDEKKS